MQTNLEFSSVKLQVAQSPTYTYASLHVVQQEAISKVAFRHCSRQTWVKMPRSTSDWWARIAAECCCRHRYWCSRPPRRKKRLSRLPVLCRILLLTQIPKSRLLRKRSTWKIRPRAKAQALRGTEKSLEELIMYPLWWEGGEKQNKKQGSCSMTNKSLTDNMCVHNPSPYSCPSVRGL